jgi:hypothetical protein
MAEKNGAGFRERVHFDEPLYRELEALSDHLRLKPADVVRMLTAVGIAQFKALSQMPGVNAALQPVLEKQMTDDVEHMTGGGSSPASRKGQSVSSGGGGRVETPQPDHHSRHRSPVDEQLPPSYLRGL